MTEYNCVTDSHTNYRITKFDDDFNVESSYLVSLTNCECPQGNKPTCRHRKMLPQFLVTKRVDSQWFLNYDTGEWRQDHVGTYVEEPLAAAPPVAAEPPEPVPPPLAPAPIPEQSLSWRRL